jgi:SAM-dependent methyltransferase
MIGGVEGPVGVYLELDDEAFVDRVYRVVLRRPPEPDARDRALAGLGNGLLSRSTLAHELVTSPEFQRVRALDDAVARGVHARARDERPRNLGAVAGSDERPIEIAWTLARYRGEPRVLDIGYANAEPAYLAGLLAAVPESPTGVDLVHDDVAGFDGVVADVRKLPFKARSFDVVFCISTLEHVGKDNTLYGAANERDPAAIPAALREIKRVLSRRGRALLTVPTGENEDRDWFIQRDPRSWRELFLHAGFAVFEHELYELADDGWRSVAELPPGVRYGTRGPGASAVLCVELRPGRARYAIRRRVRAALPAAHGG